MPRSDITDRSLEGECPPVVVSVLLTPLRFEADPPPPIPTPSERVIQADSVFEQMTICTVCLLKAPCYSGDSALQTGAKLKKGTHTHTQ